MSGLKIAVTLMLILAAPPPPQAAVRTAAEPPGTARPSRAPPSRTLPAVIRDRLVLTLRDAQAALRREWANEIAALDAAHQHLLVMADRHSDAMFSSLGRPRD